MIREFYNNKSYSDYLKNYSKVMSIGLILLFAVSVRVYFIDWINREAIIIGLLIGYPLLLLIGSIMHFKRQKGLKYIFTDDSIVKSKKGNERKYLLTEIEDICKPKEEIYYKTGMDYIKIKFRNGEKIRFDNTLPYYPNLKSFLKNYLTEKLDYNIREV